MKHCRLALAAVIINILSACSTIPVEDRALIRQDLNQSADEIIAALVAKDPALQAKIDDAEGYFTGRISGVKVPVVGGSAGKGMLFDKSTQARSYMDITRFDVGFGAGAGRYQAIILFKTREALEEFRSGVWVSGLGIDAGAGTSSAGTSSQPEEDLELYGMSETGAVMQASARVIHATVNHDLTDAGVAEVSFPSTGFTTVDQQDHDAPRIWDHKMPFLAQRVVDKGYDLPLPYSFGLTYVNVDQELLLDSLDIGLNGAAKQSVPFVSFDDASARNDSYQFKLGTWLLPFMNVFALFGHTEGKAPLDVLIDGNGMLDQLDLSCSGLPPSPLCPILEDQTFTLQIEEEFSGYTYGVGTILAGGWNNWFVAVPLSLVYADIDGKDSDGLSITVTPRGGRVFNMGKFGNLSAFAGANYLDVDFSVSGTVEMPNGLLSIDYTIEQENKDKWNLLAGFNWDINKRWAWSAEYEGFVGSRETFISSLSYSW
ncbi:MAG: hypothetical protein V7754_06875 [Halioglobus sp.]